MPRDVDQNDLFVSGRVEINNFIRELLPAPQKTRDEALSKYFNRLTEEEAANIVLVDAICKDFNAADARFDSVYKCVTLTETISSFMEPRFAQAYAHFLKVNPHFRTQKPDDDVYYASAIKLSMGRIVELDRVMDVVKKTSKKPGCSAVFADVCKSLLNRLNIARMITPSFQCEPDGSLTTGNMAGLGEYYRRNTFLRLFNATLVKNS